MKTISESIGQQADTQAERGRFEYRHFRDDDRVMIEGRDTLTGDTYEWPDYVGIDESIKKWEQRQKRTIVCGQCGKRQVPEDNECGECGTKLEMKGRGAA